MSRIFLRFAFPYLRQGTYLTYLALHLLHSAKAPEFQLEISESGTIQDHAKSLFLLLSVADANSMKGFTQHAQVDAVSVFHPWSLMILALFTPEFAKPPSSFEIQPISRSSVILDRSRLGNFQLELRRFGGVVNAMPC
jgi:hypothetical protein